jgi:hypothetical protein
MATDTRETRPVTTTARRAWLRHQRTRQHCAANEPDAKPLSSETFRSDTRGRVFRNSVRSLMRPSAYERSAPFDSSCCSRCSCERACSSFMRAVPSGLAPRRASCDRGVRTKATRDSQTCAPSRGRGAASPPAACSCAAVGRAMRAANAALTRTTCSFICALASMPYRSRIKKYASTAWRARGQTPSRTAPLRRAPPSPGSSRARMQ